MIMQWRLPMVDLPSRISKVGVGVEVILEKVDRLIFLGPYGWFNTWKCALTSKLHVGL